MYSPLWFCLVLLAAASHAKPKASTGITKHAEITLTAEIHKEDPINLHHSLKNVHDAASQAVENVQEYIHHKLNSVAHKTIKTVQRPARQGQDALSFVTGFVKQSLVPNSPASAQPVHGVQWQLSSHHSYPGAPPVQQGQNPLSFVTGFIQKATGAQLPSSGLPASGIQWQHSIQHNPGAHQSHLSSDQHLHSSGYINKDSHFQSASHVNQGSNVAMNQFGQGSHFGTSSHVNQDAQFGSAGNVNQDSQFASSSHVNQGSQFGSSGHINQGLQFGSLGHVIPGLQVGHSGYVIKGSQIGSLSHVNQGTEFGSSGYHFESSAQHNINPLHCPTCLHSYNPSSGVSHHIHIGVPKITFVKGTRVEYICSGDNQNCHQISDDSDAKITTSFPILPTEPPGTTSTIQPSTESGKQENSEVTEGKNDSDILFENGSKDGPKLIDTSDSEHPDIDIRFGSENKRI